TSARNFTTSFAGHIPKGQKGPFDAWTIHSYPTGQAGVNLDTGITSPRSAADKRVDDILSWQNALVDAVGSDSPALSIDIYDTEVNYGLAGPGIEPGQNWSADEATQLMNMTYQDSQKLGINATFWYQYTATPYDLLGVQWNPSDPGLNNMWDTMRSSGVPAVAEPSFRDSGSAGYAIPNFKNCFIRYGADCSNQNLKGIDLSGATLTYMNFSNAFLKEANLRGTTLSGVNLTGAYLGEANMRNINITGGTTKFGARSFYKADFSGAKLERVDVRGGQFSMTVWKNAIIWDCSFNSSQFYKANFDGATIRDTGMKGTRLRQTSWKNAKVTNVSFTGAIGTMP
ncbi:MAG: pentapeptide repeat-containing protein, partial [Candidatus Nanopelagicales bacterium]